MPYARRRRYGGRFRGKARGTRRATSRYGRMRWNIPRGRKYRGRFRPGPTARGIARGAVDLKRIDFGWPLIANPADQPSALDGTSPVGPDVLAIFGSANYQAKIAAGNSSFTRERNDVLVKDIYLRYTIQQIEWSAVGSTWASVLPDCAQLFCEIMIVQALINDTPTWNDFYQEDFTTNEQGPATGYNDATYPQDEDEYDTLSRFRKLQALPKWRILAHKKVNMGSPNQRCDKFYVQNGTNNNSAVLPMKRQEVNIAIKKPLLVRFARASATDAASIIAGQLFQMVRIVGYGNRGMLGTTSYYIGNATTVGSDIHVGLNARIRYVG